MSGKNTSTDILIAGAGAAFTVDLLVYPLDTLKTRLQSPHYKRLFVNASTDTINKRALFRGLYQGLGSVILATIPSSGAFFTTYEGIKSVLAEHNPVISGSRRLLSQDVINSGASSVAELVSCAILTPAEVIKQNAQMVDNSSGKQNATLQTIARFRSNPLALWRGYTALATRNLPFTAIQFPIFERFKDAVKRHRDAKGTRTNTMLESATITSLSAGTAGFIAAVITTPVDVIKTRIMLAAADEEAGAKQHGAKPKAGSGVVDAMGRSVDTAKSGLKTAVESVTKPTAHKGSITIAKDVIAEHGVKGLFRGGALRAVWTMIGSGMYLGVYEGARIYLARRNGEQISEADIM